MKSIYVLSFVLALATVNGDGYSTKNDNFNMEEVVKDVEKLKAFANCLIHEINCPEVGKEFLKDIPDAVGTSCVKCNEMQKKLFKLFVEALKAKLPNEYEGFKKKFDPEGKSFAQLEVNVGVVH